MNEKTTIAVSVLVRTFADDLTGFCARCARVVYFRPHTTTLIPHDERICTDCFLKLPPADRVQLLTTETSLREFALYRAPTGRKQ